ncbi:hypothetical protein BC938DRAFT_475705 [Jimgerdemannia flammicorona]|uniref:Nitrite/sulphite reductase 4Fe-4S domain-containing protein n=1 Tax=Jimgerdemannia flammicorona TaxID=994334 RepID=A0A433QZB6_9FUNG|nr:hypothetical protein BC938DRAFT_475705 [Jimgerdemannia flammicorona]
MPLPLNSTPYYLKGGVSGCVRECTEAQSKDFGLIGTDKGYILYMCGNGGAKPNTPLATDTSKELCIRYLDRFLIYYISTAGARPAGWRRWKVGSKIAWGSLRSWGRRWST